MRGIHNKNCTLTRRKGARDLIGEIDMTGSVNEIELIGVAIIGSIVHAHGLTFDSDAALTLDIHRIKQLILHIARRDGAGLLKNPVRQSRLTMIDMRDYGEVPYQ